MSSNFTALEAPVISVLAICRLHSRKESPLEEPAQGIRRMFIAINWLCFS